MENPEIRFSELTLGCITLRDLFAGMAMNAFIAESYVNRETGRDWDDSQVAEFCYKAADAMLAARNPQFPSSDLLSREAAR